MTSATSGEPDESVSLGAYYYPWYHSDGRHWDDGYHGKSQGTKPALGEYSSRSTKTIRQHIQWSAELGIDHWICSWWGPHSWEDETLREHMVPALAANETAPKFCLFYESAGLLEFDPEKGIDFDIEKNSRQFAEHFRYLARTYFSLPGYLKIDGKPVVYIYLTRTFTGGYAAALLRARATAKALGFDLFLVGDEVYWGEPDRKRIQQFDAVTAYNMHGPERFAGAKDWTPFVREVGEVYDKFSKAAGDVGVGFIPGVLAGFDARDAGGSYYPIPRSVYPLLLEAARKQIDPGLKTIAITSFNEWHEGTQLEPAAAP